MSDGVVGKLRAPNQRSPALGERDRDFRKAGPTGPEQAGSAVFRATASVNGKEDAYLG